MSGAAVVAVSRSTTHSFSKECVESVTLLPGLGVEGDAHAGVTVQHRSRVARDPDQPNLRQVHLLQAELLDEVARDGFAVPPGGMGENITTRGVDLLALPVGTLLTLGATAVVRLTGLRNPCAQIDEFRPGLLRKVVGRTPDGAVLRRAGVMGVVVRGGAVGAGDAVALTRPVGPPVALQPV